MLALSLGVTLAISFLLVAGVEFLFRGSLAETLKFFAETWRPGWSTVGIYALVLLALDALFGHRHFGLIVMAPLALALAFFGHQKSLYLGDPLYPSDLLFVRQVIDLMPLLVDERPFAASSMAAGALLLIAALVMIWRRRQRMFARIGRTGRLARLAMAVPALAFFAVQMEPYTFSWYRDRLRIAPMMWDQTANYDHNGFTAAFLMNIPMATVAAPAGYSQQTMRAMQPDVATRLPATKPDIIVVMSESFWDPTRLPGVQFSEDPIPTARALSSGHIFSPEFGGMTANVEFEALTGFSNAFLPFGGIPYQQYVRRPLPSLASFLGSEGYTTRALHPYRGWFWNRKQVYEQLGFQTFESEETLPKLTKRGGQVGDLVFGEEIIRQAEAAREPFFFFAVTIQGHGPYPGKRYKDAHINVTTAADTKTRNSVQTFAEGASDADAMLAELVDWAGQRERETIIVYFGDHLPPLGPAYVKTGFMPDVVAPRTAPPADMLKNRETPLVVWSNRAGQVRDLGTVSPSFLPLYVLDLAGFSHPYYTGLLRQLRDEYRVLDRYMLLDDASHAKVDWQRARSGKPILSQARLLQYDLMFGKSHAAPAFFPELGVGKQPGDPLTVSHPTGLWRKPG
jgi:phosphoglycerol transferase MdoB-like AlkP superfamily enzyme